MRSPEARVEPELASRDPRYWPGARVGPVSVCWTAVRRSDEVAGQIHWCRADDSPAQTENCPSVAGAIPSIARAVRLTCDTSSYTRPAYRRPTLEDQFSTAVPRVLIDLGEGNARAIGRDRHHRHRRIRTSISR